MTVLYDGDDHFVFAGARRVYAHAGIVGLSTDNKIMAGSDHELRFHGAHPDLTPAEAIELADYMIARWQTFKAEAGKKLPPPEVTAHLDNAVVAFEKGFDKVFDGPAQPYAFVLALHPSLSDEDIGAYVTVGFVARGEPGKAIEGWLEQAGTYQRAVKGRFLIWRTRPELTPGLGDDWRIYSRFLVSNRELKPESES